MGSRSTFYLHAIVILALATTAFSVGLNPFFYDKVCPQALPTIKRLVQNAVNNERRMGASLLRLHFHDCFVNGCDASILLDASPTILSEQDAAPNRNSIRGMDVIDQIKLEVDKVCKRSVVSCADILTVAARDSVVALGGPSWKVPLGRRDSLTASQSKANTDIPSPFLDLPGLIRSFQNQGLDQTDLVALSGGHTIGFSKCALFRTRIYNETNIDPTFRRQRQAQCPRVGGDLNLGPLDPTPANFDVAYFRNLIVKKGLLHSDQALFNGGSTDGTVKRYASIPGAFNAGFVNAMIKMGNIKPLTGSKGQIRLNCGKVNKF